MDALNLDINNFFMNILLFEKLAIFFVSYSERLGIYDFFIEHLVKS